MTEPRRLPRRRELFWRKFRSSFFPLFLAVLLLGAVSAGIFVHQAVSSALQVSNNMVLQAMQSIEMLFSSVDTVALAICQDTSTLDYLGEVFENEEALDRETRLQTERFRKFVSNISNSNPNVFSVYVYVNNPYGKYITSIEDGVALLDRSYDRGWYDSYRKNGGDGAVWTESRSIQRYAFEKPIELISRYRSVYPKGMANRGVVVENVAKSTIIQQLESLSFLRGQRLQLYDENGALLLEYTQGNEDWVESDESQLLTTRIPSERFGWTFVSLVPSRMLYQSASYILQTLFLILLCGLLFSLAVAFAVSQHKYQRALGLIQALDSHSPEAFGRPEKSGDEYDFFLESLFQDYIEKTNLEMTISAQQYQLRIMEILALQSQINPHFLFNTLDVIKWESVGLTHGENVVSEMLENLADIMRYALSDPDELIRLSEEIEVTKSYVSILQSRYVDKFEVDWQVEDDLLYLPCPKLIFQPLIENSVYHGVKERDGFCRIRIRVRLKRGSLLMRVSDNGAGMSSERLGEVRDVLAGDIPHDSIGLYNIVKRLSLLYPGACRARIFSKEGLGTVVLLRIEHFLENRESKEEGNTKYENLD